MSHDSEAIYYIPYPIVFRMVIYIAHNQVYEGQVVREVGRLSQEDPAVAKYRAVVPIMLMGPKHAGTRSQVLYPSWLLGP